MREVNWARSFIEWIPLGRTWKRRRQFMRLKDDLDKFYGVLWIRAAQYKSG